MFPVFRPVIVSFWLGSVCLSFQDHFALCVSLFWHERVCRRACVASGLVCMHGLCVCLHSSCMCVKGIWACYPRGEMAKALDRTLGVSKFELQPSYYVHFRTNSLTKGVHPLWIKYYHCLFFSTSLAWALKKTNVDMLLNTEVEWYLPFSIYLWMFCFMWMYLPNPSVRAERDSRSIIS